MPRIPKALKVFLFGLGALAGVVLLAALAVVVFVDIEDYKPRVEAAASAATGMDVKVEGPMRIGFLPTLRVVLGKVRVINRGSQLAFVETADLEIEPLPLFRKELRYNSINLEGARISVERGRDGKYSFQKSQPGATEFGGMALKHIAFRSLVFAYADKVSGNAFETGSCSGELTDMRHPGGAPFLMRLSLAGQVACDEFRGKHTATDVKFSVAATDGVFDFTPVTLRMAGGQGSGSVRVDRSGATQVVHVKYALSNFRIEHYLKKLPADRAVKGEMDFSISLAMRGQNREELKRTAHGVMSLSGKDLALSGVDLDQAFGKYAASQEFNILDLSALLVAGPFGLLATKGFELSSLSENSGGSTRIRTVVSRWKVEKGVAYAEDVAMATEKNRLALQGGLDFVRSQYTDVVVAPVDANGCAKLRQRIHGSFSRPVVEKPGVLKVLAGPAVNLLRKARDLVGGDERCEPFYKGSVAAPT